MSGISGDAGAGIVNFVDQERVQRRLAGRPTVHFAELPQRVGANRFVEDGHVAAEWRHMVSNFAATGRLRR